MIKFISAGAPFNRRQVNFVCKVECDPVCAVSWFRNGVPIQFDERISSGNNSAELLGPHHYVVKSHAEVEKNKDRNAVLPVEQL